MHGEVVQVDLINESPEAVVLELLERRYGEVEEVEEDVTVLSHPPLSHVHRTHRIYTHPPHTRLAFLPCPRTRDGSFTDAEAIAQAIAKELADGNVE